MYRPKVEISDSLIANATLMSKNRLDKYPKLLELAKQDKNRERRLAEHKCAACFYTVAIAGQAITNQECGVCSKPQQYGSTNTDILCVKCAKGKGLCKHCGGDIAKIDAHV